MCHSMLLWRYSDLYGSGLMSKNLCAREDLRKGLGMWKCWMCNFFDFGLLVPPSIIDSKATVTWLINVVCSSNVQRGLQGGGGGHTERLSVFLRSPPHLAMFSGSHFNTRQRA